jgi:hypothetical protein
MRRVYLVDTHPIHQMCEFDQLVSSGFMVESPSTEREFLVRSIEAIRQSPEDWVLVIDPRVRGTLSRDFLRAALTCGAVVVAISTYTPRQFDDLCKEEGLAPSAGYLEKPFRIAELARSIKSCLSSPNSRYVRGVAF